MVLESEGKRELRLKKVRAKSQHYKRRGKITIALWSRGRNTKFSCIYMFLKHLAAIKHIKSKYWYGQTDMTCSIHRKHPATNKPAND